MGKRDGQIMYQFINGTKQIYNTLKNCVIYKKKVLFIRILLSDTFLFTFVSLIPYMTIYQAVLLFLNTISFDGVSKTTIRGWQCKSI